MGPDPGAASPATIPDESVHGAAEVGDDVLIRRDDDGARTPARVH
jgi:hypothetical protein